MVHFMGGHGTQCENAKGHQCHCVDCGGTLHRWPGCLGDASSCSPQTRTNRRRRADQVWKGLKETERAKRSATATESMLGDVVLFLAEHPQLRDQIRDIAEKLGSEVLEAADSAIGGDRGRRRECLTNHFWCDLLAAIGCAWQGVESTLDDLETAVTERLIQLRENERPDELINRVAIRATVKASFAAFKSLSFYSSAESFVTSARLLAILICPAPEKHQAVFDCCVRPLFRRFGAKLITDEVYDRLEATLPAAWLEPAA